jgi:uncharacterized protein (TIGR03435 family)
MTKLRSQPNPIRAFLLIAACIPAFNSSAHSQANPANPATPAASPNPATFSYEVVSIKPHKQTEAGYSMWMQTTPDGFSYRGTTLKNLVLGAYSLIMDDQLVGLPSWADTEQYDMDGKMDEDHAAAFKKLPQKQRGDVEDSMMQALLADRFQLKVHKETRELPIYNLVVAKNGLKIQPSPEGKDFGYSMGMGKLSGNSIPLDTLAYSLSGQVGRIILNKTGLDGKYTIDLKWQPDSMSAGTNSSNGSEPLPDLLTALQEQLGLKLEPAKGPVDVIVVDHIERPSEN